MLVPPKVWGLAFSGNPRPDFWLHGNLTYSTGMGYSISTHNWMALTAVRFEPDGVERLAHSLGVPNAEDGAPPKSSAKRLPDAEAERVSRLILDIWGKGVTEARAVQLAQVISPEHKVSRDPFLVVFRAIRGDKKRGKAALNDELTA